MPDYTIQRFRGGFAIVWQDPATGKRRRYQLDATDRASAEAEARQWWTAALGDETTVGSIVQSYIADREAQGVSSVKRMRDAWKALCPFWEKVDPGLIDPQMCRDYRATRPVADATARYELMMLSTALGAALGKDKPKMWLPPTPERRERHLTPPQFRRFLSEVRAPHARLYMLLGIFTLARPSALLDLRWSQVDFDRGLITLNPPGRAQTAKRRPVVPMNDQLLAELRQAYADRDSEFVISRGGKGIANIKKAFQAASKRSGVHATPYTLRHTGAVWAAEQGVSMSELAQMMGHDDSRTTEKHYARYSPDYLRRVSSAVADALAGVQPEPRDPVSNDA